MLHTKEKKKEIQYSIPAWGKQDIKSIYYRGSGVYADE